MLNKIAYIYKTFDTFWVLKHKIINEMANEGHVTLCGPLAKPAAADDDCCREPLAPAAKRARVVLPAAIPYGRNGFRVRPDRTIVPTDLAYAEVYSERRARRTDFGSRCVTVLRSACDTGKTHITLEEIRDAVAADRIPYVVWIVTRIALAANICKRGTDVIRGIPANVRMEDGETETSTSFRMREARRRDDLDRFAFANYRERDAKALARSTRTIVCTLQSLPKLENSDFMKFVAECECEGKRGWLVCDESEEIGKTFSDNETMDGSKLSRAFAVLKRTARASSVILMDAWPAESTATLAACFSDRDEDVHCIYNAWRMESRSLYRSETLGQLFETMLCDLRGRQKIAKQATPLRGPKIALISTTKVWKFCKF